MQSVCIKQGLSFNAKRLKKIRHDISSYVTSYLTPHPPNYWLFQGRSYFVFPVCTLPWSHVSYIPCRVYPYYSDRHTWGENIDSKQTASDNTSTLDDSRRLCFVIVTVIMSMLFSFMSNQSRENIYFRYKLEVLRQGASDWYPYIFMM